METVPVIYPFKPGIKRDGTVTEGDYHTAGQWCRFTALGRPRKIGGYRRMSRSMHGPVYGMYVYPTNSTAYVYSQFANATTSGIEMQSFDLNVGAIAGPLVSRTPSGFADSPYNIGQFDAMFDSGGSDGVIMAHVAPNLADIASRTVAPTYLGSLVGNTALTDSTAPQVSGGVCVLHPYAFVYGDDGRVAWSGAGTPGTWTGGDSGSARVAESKIIRGMSVRGSDGNAPAGLFWSLNSVIRATFIGGTAIFNFNTIAEDVTPLSSRCMVNVDGVVYWPAADRFLMYNGAVQEIPNQLNMEYFYSNINSANRQLAWAVKVPRWGEVWFMFPFMNDTQATYAVVLNYRLGTWYDTVLPEQGRSDGVYPTAFQFPVMAGLDSTGDAYPLWQHEYRSAATDIFDKIDGNNVSAIPSSITTGDIAMSDAGHNLNSQLDRVELDLNQAGDMTLQIFDRPYPRAQDRVGKLATFSSNDTVCDDIRTEGRFIRAQFGSNVAGGFYEFGQPIFQVGKGSRRPAGA